MARLYREPLALRFVRPHARDCAVDEHNRRDPALVAVDALVVLRAEQVIFLAMSQQIGIEIREQSESSLHRRAAVQNSHIFAKYERVSLLAGNFCQLRFKYVGSGLLLA